MGTLYTARHGEAWANGEGRALGSTDGELSDAGHELAMQLGQHTKDLAIDELHSSHLLRAQATLGYVTAHFQPLQPKIYPQLAERNFGGFEGLQFDEMQLLLGHSWEDLWAVDDAVSLLGAEPLADFTTRVAHYILDLDESKTYFVVTHGGVMNRLNYLSDRLEQFQVRSYRNAEIVQFDIDTLKKYAKKYLSGSS